jgi:RNA polymerase sigma-70 factor (ECF subfamily)
MPHESSLELDEDTRLMIRAREGDRSAYEKVYCRYFHTVVSFLARRTGREQACEDLAQEVFARVWHRRNQYQPLAPVRSYLLGVAANILHESWAETRERNLIGSHDLEMLEDTRQPSPPSQAQLAEQLQAVKTLMMTLTDRQRQAVELVYLVGLPHTEAARRIGCSVRALQAHLCVARQRLRCLGRFPLMRT